MVKGTRTNHSFMKFPHPEFNGAEAAIMKVAEGHVNGVSQLRLAEITLNISGDKDEHVSPKLCHITA